MFCYALKPPFKNSRFNKIAKMFLCAYDTTPISFTSIITKKKLKKFVCKNVDFQIGKFQKNVPGYFRYFKIKIHLRSRAVPNLFYSVRLP